MAPFTAGVPFKNQAIIAAYPSARLAVQAAFGADLAADAATWTWTDITTSVRQNDSNIVSISPMGRSDEVSQAQPAGLALVLDNSSGDFTAYHPGSQYYPYVRRNTPIRVLVNLTGDDADTSVRFLGFANGWPLGWQDDGTAQIPVVNLTASGETRRLKQGKSEARSAIRRYMDASAVRPVAYWHLEDDEGSLVAASGLPGGSPMVATGGSSAGAGVKFGVPQGRIQPAYTGYELSQIGVKSFVSLAEGGILTAPVPSGSGSTWSVQFIASSWAFDTPEGTDVVLARWDTPGGSFNRYEVRQRFADSASELVGILGATETVLCELPFALIDESTYVVTCTQNGGNIDTTFIGAANYPTISRVFTDTDSRAGTLAFPSGFITLNATGVTAAGTAIAGSENQKTDIRFGHLSLWYNTAPTLMYAVTTDPTTGVDVGPWTGWIGENGVARLQRLADEHGIALEVVGTSNEAMGFLGVGNFLDLARETETSDGGLLLDGFGQGYLYVTRDARYNQTPALTASAVGAQLAPPFGPQDNDQRDVNLFVASRKGGSSATHERTDGAKGTDAIGTYDSSGTYNLYDDTPLLSYASWATHLGTVEGYRYTTLTLDFTAPEVTPLAADWLAVVPSSLVEVTDPADVFSKHPPGDLALLVEGWGEQVSPFVWKATVNCSPGAPWQVGTIEGDERLDCGASTLAEALDTTETGVNVIVADRCTWAHDDGDYQIVIGGEVMTVTAVADASAATFVAAGTASSGDAITTAPGMPAGVVAGDLLLVFGSARDTNNDPQLSISDSSYEELLDAVNFKLWAKVHSGSESAPTVSFTNGSGDTCIAQMAAFRGDFGNVVLAGASAQLNASAQNIAFPALDLLLGNCVVLWLGWKADDWTSVATLGAASGEIGEPDQTAGNDAGLVWDYAFSTAAQSLAAGSFTVTGGASAISRGAVVAIYSADRTLTVTRSVNGIVKAHNPGEEVHVLHPIILAL